MDIALSMTELTDQVTNSRVELEQAVSSLGELNELLDRASKRFEELFQGLPIACFSFDCNGQIFEWNRACQSLFRLNSEQVFQKHVWDVIGRPEDWEITKALVSSVVAGQTYESFEWEGSDPDGTVRYFICNTFPLRGINGEINGGISANIDIYERKLAEQALWESEERWQLALRGNNDGIWDWNFRTSEMFYSARWKQMLGYDESDISNSRDEWLCRIHDDDREAVITAFNRHLKRETEFYSTEHRVRCKDGSYKWLLDRGQALWTRSGDVLRVAGSITDISDRKRSEEQLMEANAKLEALAICDGLTGLTNHRGFQDRLRTEFDSTRRYGDPLSLLFLDVDHFKQFNDQFGHPAGDEVLRQVGRILKCCVRETDLPARYGGEEFVVILTHTESAWAMEVAQRCCDAIAAGDWKHRPVTASFGVASFCASMASPADLIDIADKALYVSKTSGRNRVTNACDLVPD